MQLIGMQVDPDGPQTKNKRETIEFSLRALKAMTVFCERHLAGTISAEPVKFQEETINGFVLAIPTKKQVMMCSCQTSTANLVRVTAGMLSTLKAELDDEKFLELMTSMASAVLGVAAEKEEQDIVCVKNPLWRTER